MRAPQRPQGGVLQRPTSRTKPALHRSRFGLARPRSPGYKLVREAAGGWAKRDDLQPLHLGLVEKFELTQREAQLRRKILVSLKRVRVDDETDVPQVEGHVLKRLG